MNVNVGDNIVIKAQGIEVKGEVVEATYYNEAGWYIGLTKANVPGGYSYWKQRDDGGQIIEINGVKVI